MSISQDMRIDLLGTPDTSESEILGDWIGWKRQTESDCTDRFNLKNQQVGGYASV